MPLYIKDDMTAGLVGQLATRHGLSKQDADAKLLFKGQDFILTDIEPAM